MRLFYTFDSDFIELSDLISYVKCQRQLFENTDLDEEDGIYLYLHDIATAGQSYLYSIGNQHTINSELEIQNVSWRVTDINEVTQVPVPDEDIPVGITSGQTDQTGMYVSQPTALTGVLTLNKPPKRYTIWTIKEIGLAELAMGKGV